jgi:CheY-like chemotaxis protein
MHSALPGEPMLVLVADDDEDMRAFVSDALRADGCSTREACDGQELLELLESLEEPRTRPDVLVADIRMPRLSGLGVLEVLRRAQWYVPVVLITAISDDLIHSVARRLGAVGVLRKPFDSDDLVIAVRNAKAAASLRRG